MAKQRNISSRDLIQRALKDREPPMLTLPRVRGGEVVEQMPYPQPNLDYSQLQSRNPPGPGSGDVKAAELEDEAEIERRNKGDLGDLEKVMTSPAEFPNRPSLLGHMFQKQRLNPLVEKLQSSKVKESKEEPVKVTKEDAIIKTVASKLSKKISVEQPPSKKSEIKEEENPKVLELAEEQAINAPETLGTVENLAEAQKAASRQRMYARLGSAFDKIGSAIVGQDQSKQSQEFYSALAKDSDRLVEDFQARVNQEKKDPQSSVSGGFRDYLKKIGIKLADNTSAETAEKLLPFAYKSYSEKLDKAFEEKKSKDLMQHQKDLQTEKLASDEKLEKMKEVGKMAERKVIVEGKAQEGSAKKEYTEGIRTEKRFDEVGKRLTSELASSRSAFGRAANNMRASEAIERLVSGRNLKDLDVREMQEVARSLDALLAQGQPTVSGTAKLVPVTARGDVAKVIEYITNIRQGANADSFLQQMLKTVGRERELAKEQIKRTQGKILGPYADLRAKDPDKWSTLMQIHELPEDLLSEQPSSEPSSVPKPVAPEIQSQPVKIRRKSDGMMKTVDPATAQRLLSDPNKFERL